MEYSENYEKKFADKGTRAPISDDEWEGGWRDIVGGVNGYPTSAQFNEVCGRLDRKINEIKAKKPDADGEAKDLTVTFVEAQNRENINSGESFSTIFGKIKKWFSDLGAAAFLKVAGNDTTNRSDTVPTTQVTYQHGIEIDDLQTDMSAMTDNGAVKGLDVREGDGVYIIYQDGADTVSKKLGSNVMYLGNTSTIDVKALLPNDYSGLTKDNFFVEVSSLSVNGGTVERDAEYPQPWSLSRSATMTKSYDSQSGILSIGGLSCSGTHDTGGWYGYINGSISIRVYVAY